MYGNCPGLFSYAFTFFPGTPEENYKNVSVTTLNVWVKFGTGCMISESYNSKQIAQSLWARKEIK
jgi:hypothetical protein